MRVAFAAVLFFLTIPAVVGSAAAAFPAAPHAAPRPLFAWVPAGGFPDRFPFGQCTWWAAYNRHVTWGGNARDWFVNAAWQGVATSEVPSIGAIAEALGGCGFRVRASHRQFVLPISFHKAIGSRGFTESSERLLDRIGLLRWFGSPVTLLAERCASS